MGTFLPNNVDAYAGAAVTSDRVQAVPDATDFEIIKAGMSLAGAVSTGLAVTAQATPNGTVAVASGVAIVNGSNVLVNAVASLAATGLPVAAGNNRRDIVVVNDAGTVSYVAGTVTADTALPVKPAIPANSAVLAEITMGAGDTTIDATQIIDKRIIPNVGGRVLGSASIETNMLGNTATVSTDLGGLAVPVVVGGRPIVVRATVPFFQKVTSDGYVTIGIFEGTSPLNQVLLSRATGEWGGLYVETNSFSPSVGAHTYKVRYNVSAGGVDIYGGGGVVNFISVVEQ